MRRKVPARVQAVRSLRTYAPPLGLVLGAILFGLGWVTYQVAYPPAAPDVVSPASYMLPAVETRWPTRDGGEIPGWWIPGTRGAPAILLAPGYGMGRGDALSLAAQLRDRGFNLLVYEQRGGGSRGGASTLGLDEPADMIAALDFLKTQPEIDPARMGIWGVDVAARAALKVAASRPDVRAVAADSPFDTVLDFVRWRVRDETGIENRALETGCALLFRLFRLAPSSALADGIPVEALADRPVLFVQGENRPDLAGLTKTLHARLRPAKQIVSLRTSRARLMDAAELRTYDRNVSSFFALNLQRRRAGDDN